MADAPDPRSGVDEGGSWTPAFPGQRPPIRGPAGNDAAVTHGVYSPRRLLEAAEEEYAALRQSLAPWHPSFELATRSLAEIRARKRLALIWLDEHGLVDGSGNVRGILHELPKWERRETELLREMAATVRSQQALDLDRLAQERGLVELAEVKKLQSAYVDFIVELAFVIERGERMTAEEIVRRLRLHLRERVGVLEGEARLLELGGSDE